MALDSHTMTMQEVCAALMAQGLSEPDAMKMAAEAIDDFDGR